MIVLPKILGLAIFIFRGNRSGKSSRSHQTAEPDSEAWAAALFAIGSAVIAQHILSSVFAFSSFRALAWVLRLVAINYYVELVAAACFHHPCGAKVLGCVIWELRFQTIFSLVD